nr:SNF4:AMP activated protein kinase gamma subunit [Hymenolepis microstoma]
MLPVGKAFRALCENGIRAAPVWHSETQTFSGVLTINDFLEMLTYCWRKLIGNNSSTSSGNSNSSVLEASEKLSIEELEAMSIKKWKEIRSRLTTRRSSGMDQQETIHEEDENVSQSASSSDSEQSCRNSSSGSRSSSTSNSIIEDRDVDRDSVASAPSQIGESDAPLPSKHPHSHTHYHHSKLSSVKGCDFLSTQGGKHAVRLKCHRTGGLTVIYPEDSLYSALRLLAHCKLHRLQVFDDPVCGSGNPLFVLTHRSLLAYLYKKQIDLPRPKYLQVEIRSRLTTRRSSGMDQQETIHEEDENVSQSASSSDSEQSCRNSSSGSRSSSTSNSIIEDRDVDRDSVASAPSQIGESDAPLPSKHPHSHTHYHHSKLSSVKGCDFLSTQGGKHAVRLKCHRTGGLTVIYPEDSLYSALRLLAHCKLHRLQVFDDPVCGSGNPLFVLTHRSLLAYLYKKQIDLPRPKYLQAQLKEVGVGTYKNLSLVLPSTKLVDALAFFENETVSALPVVDSYANRRLLDIFAKFDVITLILAGKHKKPDMTVQDVLDTCKQIHRGVIPIPEGRNKFDVEICLTTDTIQFALNKLMRTGYHRLIIVDNHTNCRVEGVVSISDLLYYMVLRPSPRGPIASVHAVDNKSSTETNSSYEEGTNPDWLFYSEKDPNAMGRNPCMPMVKGLPDCTDSNGKETKRTTTQEITRLRVTSESSVTTGTSSSSRSTSSSTTSSSSTYSSSSSSSRSTSSTTSTSSRSRSRSPTAVDRSNSRGLPKRAYVVDNRKSGDGEPRTKTLSS